MSKLYAVVFYGTLLASCVVFVGFAMWAVDRKPLDTDSTTD